MAFFATSATTAAHGLLAASLSFWISVSTLLRGAALEYCATLKNAAGLAGSSARSQWM